MGDVNLLILLGHVGKDPEIRYTQGGAKVANFSVATTDRWKDKSGQAQEKTTWHRCVAWGGIADVVEQYCPGGKQVHIQGSIETHSWEKDGEKRSMQQVRVLQLALLGGGKRKERDAAGDGADTGRITAPPPAAEPASATDDIPF